MKAKVISLVKLLFTRIVPLLVGMMVLVAAVLWLSGAFVSKVEPGVEDVPVARLAEQETYEVHEILKPQIEEAVGTLKAASRTAISAKVLATIMEVTVTAGDQVAAGDLLIRLDDKELKTRVSQAEQTLAAAEAERIEAQQNHDRYKTLLERQAVPQAEYDKARARLDVTLANEARTAQAVDEAKAQLSYATIVAPKAGRIVDRLAEEGDTASPGQPLLVLYDETSLRLEAPVQENLAVQLNLGEKMDVYIDALQREALGTVDEIVPQADAPSRSFLVKVALDDSTGLYEGMFGRLRIPAGERRHLCLETAAIRRMGQLEFVDVVLPDDSLEKRFVKTGRLGMPGRIEVLSGLEAGERVILHEPTTHGFD